MVTNFKYGEDIVFKGGKVSAKLELEYSETNKALPDQEYSEIVRAAKALKQAIKKLAKEHKK